MVEVQADILLVGFIVSKRTLFGDVYSPLGSDVRISLFIGGKDFVLLFNKFLIFVRQS